MNICISAILQHGGCDGGRRRGQGYGGCHGWHGGAYRGNRGDVDPFLVEIDLAVKMHHSRYKGYKVFWMLFLSEKRAGVCIMPQ